MRPKTVPIPSLRIDKPCSQNWAAMLGDDRRRFCAQCQHQVHNFSELTEREIHRLLASREGRVCGRLEHDNFGRLKTRPEKSSWLERLSLKLRAAKLAIGSALAALTAQTGLAQNAGGPAAKTEEKTAGAQSQAVQSEKSNQAKPAPSSPQSPVVEKDSEVVLLTMGMIICEKPRTLPKRKYKK